MQKAWESSELIARARAANLKALSTLTRFVRTKHGLTAESWKGVGSEGPALTLLPLSQTASHSDAERSADNWFWHPLIAAMQDFAAVLFDEARVLWASLSLDEQSKVSDVSLGLKSTLVLHGAPRVDSNFAFTTTLTRAFIEHRDKMRQGAQSGGGLGICVTKCPLDGPYVEDKEFHILHMERGKLCSRRGNSDPFTACIHDINGQLKGRGGRWARYMAEFQPLAPQGRDIAAHISATSFYNALRLDEGASPTMDDDANHAAMQIVVGLDKAPSDSTSAWMFYQLLQLLLSGIAPLYGSLRAVRRQLRRLEVEQQRMALIEQPLTNLSRALSEMQTEAQELRALLYDPSRGLFHSHSEIASFFTERHTVRLSAGVSIDIRHRADYRSSDRGSDVLTQGKAVLAAVLCRIFGRSAEIESAASIDQLLTFASWALDSVDQRGSNAFKKLGRQVRWLCGRSEAERLKDLIETGDPSLALQRIKAALFDPYKVHATSWSTLPFSLAARAFHTASRLGDLKLPSDNVSIDLERFANPTTCHQVVELFMGVAAATVQMNSVTEFRVEQSNGTVALSFHFVSGIIDDTTDGAAHLAREIAEYVLAAPRDWRIEHQSAGNFRKPFVDFASRLLGVGKAWKVIPPPPAMPGPSYQILGLRHEPDGATFTVAVDQQDDGSVLSVEWRTRPEPSTEQQAEIAVQTLAPAPILLTPSPNSSLWSGRIYLLDHCRRTRREKWPQALSKARLIDEAHSLSAMNPAEFLASPEQGKARLIFLHADGKVRLAWNEAVATEAYQGHLIHVSTEAPHELGEFATGDPRVHVCEFQPSDFSTYVMDEFIASLEMDRPSWELLRREFDVGPKHHLSGTAGWRVNPPEIVVLARDVSPFAVLSPHLRIGLLNDGEVRAETGGLSGFVGNVHTIVLVFSAGETDSDLRRRHDAARRWLTEAAPRGPEHKVRWVLWAADPAFCRNISVASAARSRWTIGWLEEEGHGYLVLASSVPEGVSLLGAVLSDTSKLPEPHRIADLERLLADDPIRTAVTGMKSAIGAGEGALIAAAVRTLAQVVDNDPECRLDNYCVQPSHDHGNAWLQWLRENGDMTDDVTYQQMEELKKLIQTLTP